MVRLRRVLAVMTLAIAAVTTGVQAAPAGADAPVRSIVVYRDQVNGDALTSLLERLESFRSVFRYHRALNGFAAELTPAQARRIAAHPDVAFVSPDRAITVAMADVLASGDSAPTGTRRIAAATTTTANQASTVGVAVLDTGIDSSHPDLNVGTGTNCVTPGAVPQDDHGHGTHVAGTIGARNNGSGVVGVVPGTTLYPVKVLDASGSGLWSQVICGIDWVAQNAATRNIKVANLSLAGAGSNDNNCGNTNSDALHKAICTATTAGVTFAVAAGNSGADLAKTSPADYPEVLTATAMSDTDGLPGGTGGPQTCATGGTDDSGAAFSNFAVAGTDIDHTIAAPGVCIRSSWPGGGYAVLSGTSMASPHIAGSIALCLGVAGGAGPCAGMTPAQVIQRLRADAAAHTAADTSYGFTGDPLNRPTSGHYLGHLAWDGSDFSLSAAPANPTTSVGTAVGFDLTVSPAGQFTSAVALSAAASSSVTLSQASPTSARPYAPVHFTASAPAQGTYAITVTGVGEGLTRTATVNLTVASSPSAPTLTATAGNAAVSLSWPAPATGGAPIRGYNLYRGTAAGAEALVKTLGNVNTYNDTGLKNGVTYYYRLSAVNGVGEGPLSAERSAKPAARSCLIICL